MSASSGAQMINIKRDVQDPYYRYKMPRIQSKIEGKGNGIKTVIPNLVDIGKALGRPPSYITKFFGAEVGALSKCDEAASKYLVNGVHDAEKLQGLLDGFINKFVLCSSCENPETFLTVSKKDGTINRTCQACGHRGPVDMSHKLVTFIRAHPPPKPKKHTQARDRAEDGNKFAQQSDSSRRRASSPLNPEVSGTAAEGASSTLVDSIEMDYTDQQQQQPYSSVIDEDEDDWAEEEAARIREEELADLSASVLQKLSIGDDKQHQHPLLDLMDQFAVFLQDNSATSEQILAEIDSNDELDPSLAVIVAVQVLLKSDQASDAIAALNKHATLFASIIGDSVAASLAFLYSLDRLVTVISPKIIEQTSAVAIMLQMAYDRDLVEEDILMQWYTQPSKRFVQSSDAQRVRLAAKPFFDWLASASSEEDDDDDEE